MTPLEDGVIWARCLRTVISGGRGNIHGRVHLLHRVLEGHSTLDKLADDTFRVAKDDHLVDHLLFRDGYAGTSVSPLKDGSDSFQLCASLDQFGRYRTEGGDADDAEDDVNNDNGFTNSTLDGDVPVSDGSQGDEAKVHAI